MNDLLIHLGLAHWKPYFRLLLLPPTSPLLLGAIGLLLAWRWRRLGRALLALGLVSMWLLCTPAVGDGLTRWLTQPPPVLSAAQVQALAGAPATAILVLGAGRDVLVPEYRGPDVRPLTLARLRYGLWLARQTRLPVGYSGGIGHGAAAGPSEAEVAAEVAERDFKQPLRWRESRARDTHENAQFSVAMLQRDGIRQIVLVTHGFHQRRALAGFQRAIAAQGADMRLVPAPMGPPVAGQPLVAGDWLPKVEGLEASRLALYEWLGWLAGA